MSHASTTSRFNKDWNSTGSKLSKVNYFLKLTFIDGPKELFTSQISVKCAVSMIMMCLPSLLICSMLTIPALLFQSPHQQAYYYFSLVLEQDPFRWIVLLLSGICAVMSLAVPATMPVARGYYYY